MVLRPVASVNVRSRFDRYGREHGEENSIAGALMAQAKGIDVVYIGSIQDDRVNLC